MNILPEYKSMQHICRPGEGIRFPKLKLQMFESPCGIWELKVGHCVYVLGWEDISVISKASRVTIHVREEAWFNMT